jgi:outer membrane protein OmpA-like peptidoglycan-associated protein
MPAFSFSLNPRHRQRLLLAAKILVGVIAAYALFGFFAAPLIVKTSVARTLGEQIGRKIEFGEVRINPFALTATLRNIALYEPDQKTRMLTVGEAHLNASAASFLRMAPVITEVRIEQPLAHIVRNAENRFNFADIVDKIAAQPKSSGSIRFIFNNLHLRHGQVDYEDRLRQSHHKLSDIDLAIPFLSNLQPRAEIFTKPAFSAKLDGSPFAISGKTRPFAATRDTALQIDLDGLSLPEYMALIPAPLNFRLESGLLDTRLNLDFHQSGTSGSVVISGHAAVRELKLQDKSGAPLLQAKSIAVELERVEPFNQLARLATVKLEAPILHAQRQRDGTLNLLQAFTVPSASPAPNSSASAQPAAPTAPFAFTVAQAEIVDGEVEWRDAAAGPVGAASLSIRKLDATLVDFNSDGSKPAHLKASMESNAAEKLNYEATLAANQQSLEGQLKVVALQPQRLQPYFAGMFAAGLGETRLDATLPHHLAWPTHKLELTLQQASLRLHPLQLTLPQEKTPSINAQDVALTGLQLNLAKRSVSADQLMVNGAKISANRNQKGQIDLLAALASPASSPGTAASSTAASKPSADATGLWNASLKHVKVEQSEARFNDALVAPQNGGKPALQQLAKLSLALDNIALQFGGGELKSAPIPLSLKTVYGQHGTLSASGTLNLQPLGANLQIDGQRLDITAFQPYFAERSNATFSSGMVNASGKLALQLPEQKPPRLDYAGALSLTGVRTRDRISGDDFARWKTLALGKVHVQLNTAKNPLILSLGNLALTDFYARIIVNPNGRLNLQDIISNPEHGETAATTSLTQDASPARSGASAATAAGSSTPQIRIGQIALQGGNINFSDNFIKPNYSANLTGMNGSISELASDQETPAEVLLKGKLDNDAPVEITGKLNPLGPQLYLDLAASAHGIELARLTPYATKYAGYSITKGKLSADVKYHVENGQLQAQNSLRLDQLTFGDKVESPTATKLPVLLAVALLRNSRGEINLNLPVSGSLSDPEFSVGGVIARAFVNLLTKAITAPFSLLASAFSGSSDSELSYVEFAPGSSNLSADATKKLDTLAKALNDRPALTLDITGRIEPESDRDGVRQAYLDRRLRLQKIEDLRNQGSAIQMRDVKIEPSEYAKYLERAYKAEKIDKPRNLIGFAKSLPTAEMEQLMLANAPVGETELKALADQRAMAVKRYLEQQGKVGNDRMFLVAPKLNADGIKDDGKPNRVEFAIRH